MTVSVREGSFRRPTRRQLLQGMAALWLGSLVAGARARGAAGAGANGNRPNVLFIAIDDLNHWVHHLGRNEQTITPNLDRLAQRGVTFTHAYAAAPVCNPSRAALMSGLLPSTSGVYDNSTDWRPHISHAPTA